MLAAKLTAKNWAPLYSTVAALWTGLYLPTYMARGKAALKHQPLLCTLVVSSALAFIVCGRLARFANPSIGVVSVEGVMIVTVKSVYCYCCTKGIGYSHLP